MQINAYSKANYFPTEFDSLETDTIQTESMDFPPEESIAEIEYPSESYTYTPASEMQAVEDYTYANLILQAQQNATQENVETSSIDTNEALVEESEVQKVTIIGTREEGDDVQKVTITGKREEPEIDPWQGLTVGDLFGNPLPPDVQPETVVEPPEVHTEHVCPNQPTKQPANVDLGKLRQAILSVSSQMKSQSQFTEQEYGALIYADANGNLRVGKMEEGTTGHSVTVTTDAQPGEKLVAWIHSHPGISNQNAQGIPSKPTSNAVDNGKGDTGTVADLLKHSFVDPGALMYILDERSGKIYEYTFEGSDSRTKADGTKITSESTKPCH